VLVAGVAETARVAGGADALFSVRWRDRDHPIDPRGHDLVERFRLVGTVPEWTFSVGDVRLVKRVWMEQGEDTTYVRYSHQRGDRPLELSIDVFVEHRPFHETTAGAGWTMQTTETDGSVVVSAFEGAVPVVIMCDGGRIEARHVWHEAEYLEAESDRGLDATSDRLLAATVTVTLPRGRSATLRLSVLAGEADGDEALARRRRRDAELVAGFERAPAWVRRLVWAADQFVVTRGTGQGSGTSAIAGYPWFEDWGRDAMIALPGLLLATGRQAEAAEILSTYASSVVDGLIPNRFPDQAERPEYNTADATLWFITAVGEFWQATADESVVRRLWPTLTAIVAHHLEGTRHGIGVDPADGLLRAGEPGLQLTWMDAKVGDHVVTPRMGKPVEVNALWYHALRVMHELAESLEEDGSDYARHAAHAGAGFSRFWDARLGYCLDVLDGPDGDDPTLRPNQILAVSLSHSPLTIERRKSVVDTCWQELFTPYGLRTLARSTVAYRGRYRGGPVERDSAYHQGTVWPWLLGHFARAHHRVYRDATTALSFLDAIPGHLTEAGVGTVSEIFDGDPPHRPGGTPAQAWSVAVVLRTWQELSA
jgi:predicted glycogen debranching enzyme